MCDQTKYIQVPYDQRGAGMLCGFDKDGNEVALKPTTLKSTPPPNSVPIVSMCEHKGRLYVATSEGVYRLEDGDKLVRLMFVKYGN